MNKIQISDSPRFDIRAFLAAVILILMTPPIFVWGLFAESYFFRFALSILYLLCICGGYAPISQKKGIPLYLTLILLFFYFRGDFNFFSAISTIILSSSFLLSPSFINKIAQYFFKVLSIILIPSIIQFVLVEFCNISFPHKTIPPLNELKVYGYDVYTFYTMDIDPMAFFPRFCSYFDEPGVVGSFCAIALCCNNFNLKNTYNIPILIAGILSFSLFFYLVSIIYFLFFFKIGEANEQESQYRGCAKEEKSRTNNKRILLFGKLLIVFLFLALFLIIYYMDNEMLNTLIINRLQFDEEKGFSGNTRDISVFKDWYDKFRFSSDYWFGLGKGASLKLNEGGASYKNIIVDYGFIGFFMYLFLFILYALNSYKKNKRSFCIFCLIFFSMVYQRPFITQAPYCQLFLFTAVCIVGEMYHSNSRYNRRKTSHYSANNLRSI